MTGKWHLRSVLLFRLICHVECCRDTLKWESKQPLGTVGEPMRSIWGLGGKWESKRKMKCILLRGSVLGEQCRPWDGEHSDLDLAVTLTGLMLIRVMVLSGWELAVQLNSFSEYFSRHMLFVFWVSSWCCVWAEFCLHYSIVGFDLLSPGLSRVGMHFCCLFAAGWHWVQSYLINTWAFTKA